MGKIEVWGLYFLWFDESGGMMIGLNVFGVFGREGEGVVDGLLENGGGVCVVGWYEIG